MKNIFALGNLKNQKIQVFLFVFIVVIFGFPFLFSLRTYEAKSTLMIDLRLLEELNQLLDDEVRSANAAFQRSPADQTIAELEELLRTDSFIRLILRSTYLEENMSQGEQIVRRTIADVREAIYIEKVAENQIEIRGVWSDEITAVQLANSTVESFILWKANKNKRDAFAPRGFLEQLIPQYEQEYLNAVDNLDDFLFDRLEVNYANWTENDQETFSLLIEAVQIASNRYTTARKNWEMIQEEEQQKVKMEEGLTEVYQPVYACLDRPYKLRP